MIFSKLFRSKSKNKYEREDYEEEQARTRYASLDADVLSRPEPLRDDTSSQHYVVDLCEQMIDASRELESTREEYQLVTNYLNDVQTLEDMPKEQKAPLVEYATHVAKLDTQRSEFLQTEHKLSETQFAQMQEAENELPDVIKRLKANETYLDAIRKDLSYLEGEKLEWSMLRSDARHQQKVMRKMSVYLLSLFAAAAVLFAILALVLRQNTQIPMMIAAALVAVLGVYILVKYQNAGQDIRRADVNRNHAISLENHVKIKYVNIKNAVDYTCEKYHARDSRDLEHIYELYQEEVREREKLRKTSDELEYYSRQLVLALRERHFYDASVWINHANAIIDSREMVELKHDLIARRQKLRSQIEYNINTIAEMKQEAMRYVSSLGTNGPQVQQIIHKIEEISASL